MLLNAKKVVFFCAHADDEVIAAGTLRRLSQQGADVDVVAFGPCAVEDDLEGGERSATVAHEEWYRSLGCINATPAIDPVHGWRQFAPSKTLAGRGQQIADYMYNTIAKWRYDAIITLSPHDENPAHAVVGVQAERVARGRVATLIRCHYPWNYSYGHCNLFVQLEPEHLEVKRKVIQCYQSQRFRYDYETLLMHQVIADGLSVKVPAAEKFELIRSVV